MRLWISVLARENLRNSLSAPREFGLAAACYGVGRKRSERSVEIYRLQRSAAVTQNLNERSVRELALA
nr:hypothetical protein [uncultured Campylobacter sp.]